MITLLKSSVLWDIVPCSLLKANWCFGWTCWSIFMVEDNLVRNQHGAGSKQSLLLQNVGWISTDYGYFQRTVVGWTTVDFQQTKVDFQWTIWHYIPKDRTLHKHCCENLKYYSLFSGFKSVSSSMPILDGSDELMINISIH
jgi:hypothetical protein